MSKKCDTYILDIKGEKRTFNNKNELALFLSNNADSLIALLNDEDLTKEDIKLSDSLDQQKNTISKLQNLNEDSKKIIKSNKSKISVTKVLSELKDPDTNLSLIPEFNDGDLKKKLTEILYDEIKEEDETKKKEIVDEQLKSIFEKYKKLPSIGTFVHYIMEQSFIKRLENPNTVFQMTDDLLNTFITDYEKENNEDYKKFLESFNNNELTNLFKADVIKYVNDFHNNLNNNFKNCIFVPEIAINGKAIDKNITGVIDLLVIDKNGKINAIIDYKTHHSDSVSKVKELSHSYQLALYKQMLNNNGFDTRQTKLYIAPIKLEFESNSLVSLNEDGKLLDHKNSSLVPDNPLGNGGIITKQVEHIIPSINMNYEVNTNDLNLINELDAKLLGYNTKNKMAVSSYDNFIKNNIKEKKQRGKTKYQYWDKKQNSYVSFNTLEEAENSARKYLEMLAEDPLALAGEISSSYSQIESETDPSKRVFNPKIKGSANLTFHFDNYLKQGYKINDSLIGSGVIMLYHSTLKVVDFIYVNNDNLGTLVPMKYGKRITSNLLNRKQVEEGTLESTIGNIELMRLMAVANEIMPKHEDYKLQKLKIINYYEGTSYEQPMKLLIKNWNSLINAGFRTKNINNYENNFENKKIQILPYSEQVLNLVDYITSLNQADSAIINFNKELYASSINQSEKIKMLHDLLINIRKNQNANDLITPLNKGSEEYKQLYYVVANAIVELKSLELPFITKNIENISVHNDYTSDQDHSPYEVMNKLNREIISKCNLKIKELLSTELLPIKKYATEFIKKSPRLDVKLNAFDHLIIADTESSTFSVKNPYDSIEMGNNDKEFLIKFLQTVNSIRFPETNGDHKSPEAQQYINSGLWFHIPLKRGSAINRFFNKDGFNINAITSLYKDSIDKVTNVMEVLSVNGVDVTKSQEDVFDQFINPMMLESGNSVKLRNQMIADHSVDYFSRNLADIAAEYLSYDIMSKVYGEALPVIKASMIIAHGSAIFNNFNIDKTLDTFTKRLQTLIYKKQHLSPNEKRLMNVVQPLSTIASTITLPFKITSFVRELIQGRYNNYGRILTKYGGEINMDVKNLTEGYMTVLGEGLESAFRETKMNKFNLKFAIFTRSKNEHIEAHKSEKNPRLGQVFKSGAMYWLNGIPDYEHRMALFIGYLKQNKCYSAYELNENGDLVYNFEKDERFENVRKLIKGEEVNKYDENISVYNMLITSFNKHRSESEQLSFGDPLPEAITPEQLHSFHTFVNLVHGNMDDDTKMGLMNFFIGKVFGKFLNYTGSKFTALGMNGGRYSMLERVYETDPKTGEPLYTKLIKDDNGKVIGCTLTTDINDSTGEKAIALHTMYEEGLFQTIAEGYKALKNPEDGSFKRFYNESEREVNSIGFYAIDMFMFLSMIFASGLIDWKELKEEDYLSYVLARGATSAFEDNNMFSLGITYVTAFDSAILKINLKLLNNSVKFLTNDDYSLKEYIASTYSAGQVLNFF